MSDIETIEISLEDAKAKVALADATLRLIANPDFQKVVDEGYFRERAVRLTSCLGEPSMDDEHDKIVAELSAIAHCQRYFREILQMGEIQRDVIAQSEEALDELRAEEVGQVNG